MGDFERESNYDSEISENKRKPVLIAVIMLLLGLFAPFLMMAYGFEWMSSITILSLFWSFYYSSMGFSPGFMIHPLFMLTSMFPIVLLRLVPVLQIHRYYNGKTTRKRAVIANLFGDGFFLIYGLLIVVLSFGFFGIFIIPLPFQMIFGMILLWRFPISEPTTPWESVSEPKSWWEKEPEDQEEKQEKKPAKDNDDVLW